MVIQLVSPPDPRQFDWLCASLVILKDRISPSSTDIRRGSAIGRPELAAELVRLKVDIIVVVGGASWVLAAKNATKTIPIVMTGAGGDPVKAGQIESLARPGGNVTGITNLSSELSGKRLELLKEAVPKLARVAVLYDPANPNSISRGERGSPSRGACVKVDCSTLGGTRCGRFRQGVRCAK